MGGCSPPGCSDYIAVPKVAQTDWWEPGRPRGATDRPVTPHYTARAITTISKHTARLSGAAGRSNATPDGLCHNTDRQSTKIMLKFE